MTIKIKKASQKELAEMNIDAQDFEAVEAVEVNGRAVAGVTLIAITGKVEF